MANATAVAQHSFVREKILLGMSLKEYLRAQLTPTNAVATFILIIGVPLLVYRFAAGLGATTNLSQSAPWGLWIGFDMMTGIVLAAGGFTIGSAVQLFGLKDYHGIERPAILTAFLGYVMAVIGLLADLGRPWNIIMALFNFGTASVLFEVAWCVMCYTTVLLLEFTVPMFEWLGWKRIHSVMKKTLIALTVLSVIFSTMHQSALGSLFLLAPTKLHPLWYTPYIFVFFFVSAIIAGLNMVIFESALSHRIFQTRADHHVDVDKLTIGLGKAAAVVMFAYFFLKLQSVVDGHSWGYLATGYGAWWLVEVVGFVLLPSLVFAYGARNRKVKLIRAASVIGVLGVVLNRLNISVIAFNWNRVDRYVPSWMEIWVSITLVTIGVLAYRWIVNRMPILRGDPAFPAEH
ncbi:Polysulphide reductase NrfD [Anaeromyxobacter dehalogenans 2CP-1]|uniref:Polysulphide reductase NrfD n=1 Tax=Anaeromyxobacter dehalogenans (strain ATCC BAA-258 / DSM 21875 / 2CP-1) TaxID=455488 RepID=B8J7A9_ANAD2|nr:NrfD/PsrC family molybdoenzyme membrane anchor subunit [Anaeromyxobacter dehalogenans]ACL65299.1 Polysulphide reductase NrfD [Anaeromyxobacter dehalogenans 2CP-1]